MSENKSFITVGQGMAGWFAVLMMWNKEGFYEPGNTGFGRYKTREEALDEARDWAEAEGLEMGADD